MDGTEKCNQPVDNALASCFDRRVVCYLLRRGGNCFFFCFGGCHRLTGSARPSYGILLCSSSL